MKHVCQVGCCAVLLASAMHSNALTPAGTAISNQATLTYLLPDGDVQTSQSQTVSFVVMQLLDVQLVSMDATNVLVNAPDMQRVLTFKVTNSGNGAERFELTRTDKVSGNDFDPSLPNNGVAAMYLENGLEPGFQSSGPNADIKYIAGSNDPMILADHSQLVYVVSDIAAGLATNAMGKVQFHVAGLHIDTNARAGSVLGNVMVDGQTLEHILGATHGVAEAFGTYKVSGLTSSFDKTVIKTVDPKGGSQAVQGSIISYQLTYNVKGEGAAQDVVITDTVPDHMVYIANSCKVNGISMTDVLDTDSINVTNGVITARLGTQAPPYNALITYDMRVQ